MTARPSTFRGLCDRCECRPARHGLLCSGCHSRTRRVMVDVTLVTLLCSKGEARRAQLEDLDARQLGQMIRIVCRALVAGIRPGAAVPWDGLPVLDEGSADFPLVPWAAVRPAGRYTEADLYPASDSRIGRIAADSLRGWVTVCLLGLALERYWAETRPKPHRGGAVLWWLRHLPRRCLPLENK